MLVFCDLDQTLCNNDERWAKYRQTGDLNDLHSMGAVLKDEPISQVVNTIEALSEQEHEIVILTARHEFDREVTEAWLRNNYISYQNLIMAHDDDESPAKDFKLWEIDNYFVRPLEKPGVLVLDDNPEIVEHLRKHGYTVFQVK